jgi:hypothetical protein
MDLWTLAQTLSTWGVRHRSQPQLGNASVVLVGSDAAAFEQGLRSMLFSSNDVLAVFPAPVVVAKPGAGHKLTLVDETKAKLRQLFPDGLGPRDTHKALAKRFGVSVSTIKRALDGSD